MTGRETRKRALEYLTESIHRTIDSIDCAATDGLVDRILAAERVFLYGAGRSGFVTRCFAMRLGHLGMRVVRMSIDETDAPRERDLALIVSGTGETSTSLLYGRLCKDAGAPLAIITESEGSTLAEMADVVIHLNAPDDSDRARYAPMGTVFEDTCLIFLDTLVVEMMSRLEETEATMRGRHGQIY